jgi:hypothetical protein
MGGRGRRRGRYQGVGPVRAAPLVFVFVASALWGTWGGLLALVYCVWWGLFTAPRFVGIGP